MEWAALSGDEVEAVLSNLLYNEFERALRVRPSQGDFGIDVIVPTPENRWDVYQIKKFSQNLTSNQKGQVEDSFRRVILALVRRNVPLNNWYLVMPLDPTLDNLLDWFQALPQNEITAMATDPEIGLTEQEKLDIHAWLATPGRIIDWKGLDFCQKLTGDYPYVVDYYLHGGRERLREAVADLAKLLSRDATLPETELQSTPGSGEAALLQPAEIRDHLIRLDRVLDTDPHFRYGHSIEPNRPDLRPEPGLLAATQESLAGGRWLTFKIYQRSAQSLDERPIPIELEFDFEDAPADRESFDLWRKYGKPFEGTARFKVDFPGGLHGEATAGHVRLTPADGEGNRHVNRMRIVGPDGTVTPALRFSMTTTTGIEGTGLWAQGEDETNTVTVETLIDTSDMSGKINFAVRPLAGLLAERCLPAVTFSSHLVAPNVIEVAAEFGDFAKFTDIATAEPLVAPAVVRLVQSLATIQRRASVPILIPDVSEMEDAELAGIKRAASLVDGHTVVGTWTQMTVERLPGVDLDPNGHYQVAVTKPLTVHINGAVIMLGGVRHEAQSARVTAINATEVQVVPHLNDTVRALYVADAPSCADGKYPVAIRQVPE